MDEPGYTTNATFNPYAQDVVLLMPDGVTPTLVNIGSVFELQAVVSSSCIIYGIQMGISAVMLLVLLLMTKPEKRRNVVFILNTLAILVVFVRSIVQCATYYGPYWNYYNWSMLYYPNDHKLQESLAELMAAEVLGFLVSLAIELSMLFQTFTVTNMLRTRYRTVTNISCLLVAFATIGVRFATMIVNAKFSIYKTDMVTPAQLQLLAKMVKASNSCIVSSIIFFSAVFTAKLGQAIRKRRSIGLKQFGPIQVIFVMGCQTLFIPAIFGILSYWILPHSPLNTMMLCVVATFLPLSSIWASTKTDGGNNNIAAPKQWHNQRTVSNTRARNDRFHNEKDLIHSTINTTLVDDSPRGESFSGAASKKTRHHATVSHDSLAFEMAMMDHEVQVNRTYGVRND